MHQDIRIVEIATPSSGISAPEWLAQAGPIHRQLRPNLPADYAGRIAAIVRGGAAMSVAIRAERVVGLAVYRFFENSHAGLRCYVDDLVGRALIDHLQALARARACRSLELESGSQRSSAHRFYFREGFVITGFSFKKDLQ
jgi:GNAT superfamily N-acetyltransferase